MKIYTVGGAVRDELLRLPVVDRDYVVVGATPEEMLSLGYRPVGKDFPVFLHPDTHEEYALARTERKTAPGYRGFEFHAAPDVTLEDDLARRDLTINAIAKDEQGFLIDPFGGAADLEARMLRHVGPAFVEDPVRILRVARFAARLGFDIAPSTLTLMSEMVDNGEVDALVSERVWQELARGLMEREPSRMFRVLDECGALAIILPELASQFAGFAGMRTPAVLDAAASRGLGLAQRFALIALRAGEAPIVALCERLRVTQESCDLALLAARHYDEVMKSSASRPEALLRLIQAADALRRPERFMQLLEVCEVAALDEAETFRAKSARLQSALAAAQAVDTGAIAKLQPDPQSIKHEVARARLAAIRIAVGVRKSRRDNRKADQ